MRQASVSCGYFTHTPLDYYPEQRLMDRIPQSGYARGLRCIRCVEDLGVQAPGPRDVPNERQALTRHRAVRRLGESEE